MELEKTLLVVDDDENIIKAIKRLLRKEGYSIITAANGLDALEKLKQTKVQVIISDLKMPLMTGEQFLAEAKNIQPDAIRMIFSSYADFDAVVYSINNGLTHRFLSKPWNDNEIKSEINNAFQKYDGRVKQNQKDPLTNLLNRKAFMISAEDFLDNDSHDKAFVLFNIDLDRFMNVNSAFDNNTGDEVLKQVSQKLNLWTEKNNGIIGRLGGDEFVILISLSSQNTTQKILEKARALKDEFNSPFMVNDHTFYIKASIGVAHTSKGNRNLDDFLSCSKAALTKVKQEGRDGFELYDKSITQFLKRNLEIESDLYSAIEKNELFLEYQPLVDLSGVIVGCEALVRWQHPTFGCLYPKDFLDISEKTNFICEMGAWCLEKSCEFIKHLNSQSAKDFFISVNLSPRQIFKADIPALVQDVLNRLKISADFLELEVTETLLIQDPSLCESVLNQLSKLGVKIVLDDFGTGYSSLSYLTHFPFSKFKIDRSFITDIEHSQDAVKMIDSIINMGKNLKMSIVIEGVENKAQYQILQKMNCDFLQGYYFSKSLKEREFLELALNS